MQLIGFNFTKIAANVLPKPKDTKERKIDTNIEFTNIETEKMSVISSDVLKISFRFDITYEPKIAAINFEGLMYFRATPEEIKEATEGWKKKKIDENMKIPIFNVILGKCSLKALQLEEDLGLPPHLPYPRLTRNPQK